MLNLTNLAKFVNVDRVSMTYGIGKGMTQLSRLVHMAEEVVLRRGRRPVVRLVPIVAGEDGAKRKPGRMRDRISMSEDFDEWPEDVARALGIVD
jgi:hypothetical protein